MARRGAVHARNGGGAAPVAPPAGPGRTGPGLHAGEARVAMVVHSGFYTGEMAMTAPAIGGVPAAPADGSRPQAMPSYDALYREHAAPVGRFVARSVGNPHEAEDICQEVWLRVHASLGTLRERAAARSWLYRTAQHLCIDRARRRRRELACDSLDGTVEPPVGAAATADPAAVVVRNEEIRLAWLALAALPPRQHMALYLREVDGRPHQEIAERLGCTTAAVETLLARARRGLARSWPALSGSSEARCQAARCLLDRRREGDLTPIQALALRQHAADCEPCSAAARGEAPAHGRLPAFGLLLIRGLTGGAARLSGGLRSPSWALQPWPRLAMLGTLAAGGAAIAGLATIPAPAPPGGQSYALDTAAAPPFSFPVVAPGGDGQPQVPLPGAAVVPPRPQDGSSADAARDVTIRPGAAAPLDGPPPPPQSSPAGSPTVAAGVAGVVGVAATVQATLAGTVSLSAAVPTNLAEVAALVPAPALPRPDAVPSVLAGASPPPVSLAWPPPTRVGPWRLSCPPPPGRIRP